MAPLPLVPPLLRSGDMVRVVAPARSRSFAASPEAEALIRARFERMGLRLTFGAHVDQHDAFDSSSIEDRVTDLEAAFRDEEVAAVLAVIGGYNSIELLPHFDFAVAHDHPKPFIGSSDLTVLQNALLARAELVSFSGPNWASFAMRDHFEQTLSWFETALMRGGTSAYVPSPTWTDDRWFQDQNARSVRQATGPWIIQGGCAEGTLLGGGLTSLNLLRGTRWFPNVRGSILFVEDSGLVDLRTFARELGALLLTEALQPVSAVLIGRFQQASDVVRRDLELALTRVALPSAGPVVANLDFGHSSPQLTIPVGGWAQVDATEDGFTWSIARRRSTGSYPVGHLPQQ